MSSPDTPVKGLRLVQVIPLKKSKIKRELEDDDMDTVSCRLCAKSFSSEWALSNHARVEHIEAYASGDPAVWTSECTPKKAQMEVENHKIIERTKQMISTMEPTNLTSFASSDISYIIIKEEDEDPLALETAAASAAVDGGRRRAKEKIPPPKKEKEAQPITGPFECLQPSSAVAGGVCHQIFFSCCEYSAHHRDEHTRRRRGARCQVCEAPLTPPGAPHACQVCGLGFETIDELTEHTNRAHVKLKPYACGVCHKRFTQQGGVAQHMRRHTGDRPFPCTVCPKAFTQKSGLDQHLRIHTKHKPYRCVVCGKQFCQSVHLRQHMRTHTNVAPFQCALCQKRFKQSSHLNYHLRAHDADTHTHADALVEVEIGDGPLEEFVVATEHWDEDEGQQPDRHT